MPVTPGELAEPIGCTYRNVEHSAEISSLAALQHASPGEISFLADRGYRN